jgi:glycosyltransferase involved in cell wall biosynthesis
MPQISVIVPVYKVEPYLHRCVDSILAQTFVDFDLILVDDGSPDRCPAICDEYALKDSRIKVIHQPNGGLSAARNAGLDWIFTHSDSQWVFFIDSDDWIHPMTLECLLDANQQFNTSVSACGYEETSGKNPEVNTTDLVPTTYETELFFVERNTNAVIACGKLYRKDCFQVIRYPVGKIHEDEYITHKILFQYPFVAFIAAPLYAYFSNPQGITKSEWSPKRLDAIDALKQQCDFFEANGYKKAYKLSCRKYLIYLASQTQNFKQKKN